MLRIWAKLATSGPMVVEPCLVALRLRQVMTLGEQIGDLDRFRAGAVARRVIEDQVLLGEEHLGVGEIDENFSSSSASILPEALPSGDA